MDNVCEWVVKEGGRSFGSGNTEMEDYSRKRGIYLLVFLVMLILNAYYCHASAVQVKGNTTFPCNDGLGECLIIEDEWDPYARRMLTSGKAGKTNNPTKLVFEPCGGKKDNGYCYKPDCIKRGPYDRNCGHPKSWIVPLCFLWAVHLFYYIHSHIRIIIQ